MKLAEARPRKQDKDNTLEDFFNKRLREVKKKILDVLTNIGVPDDVLMKLSFVPAGELSEPSLPDRENWVNALYVDFCFQAHQQQCKGSIFIGQWSSLHRASI